jgi:hypothetical protein
LNKPIVLPVFDHEVSNSGACDIAVLDVLIAFRAWTNQAWFLENTVWNGIFSPQEFACWSDPAR